MAALYTTDPLQDPRWPEFLDRHPHSSVFHTRGWLDALCLTYGYKPVAFTTSPPSGELRNALLFCRIGSWLTGSRLVSLAFSDHCQPLVSDAADFVSLVDLLLGSFAHHNCDYIELRPLPSGQAGFEAHTCLTRTTSFYHHSLNLRPDLDTLFCGLHKDCIQRKIHRATREGLGYEEGRSETILRKFYSLLILTRRRHGLVPQPLAWFRNLLDCMRDALTIRVVCRGEQPVAAMMTLHHGNRVTYKYGASDAQYHNLGGVAFLFWRTIQAAKRSQAAELDLGRSDFDDTGLIAFKNRLGANSTVLNYYRYPRPRTTGTPYWQARFVSTLCTRLPASFCTAAGKLLYRHIG